MSKLYIVGTPIGNIRDITLRALDVLKEVHIIACEDTRVTKNLLSKFDLLVDKKLIAYHDKNEKASAKGIVELLKSGQDVALVSDAGMPVINDPGYEVIREALKEDVQIEVIPGVSATLMTLVLSNFDTHFKFDGFLKPKSGQRVNQLKELEPGTHIFFVSPHQLMESLEDVKVALGEDTNVFLGRELTKMYETHYRGTIVEVMDKVKDEIKGEFTMAIEVKKRKVNKYAK